MFEITIIYVIKNVINALAYVVSEYILFFNLNFKIAYYLQTRGIKQKAAILSSGQLSRERKPRINKTSTRFIDV